MMAEMNIYELLTSETFGKYVRVVIIAGLGFPLAFFISTLAGRSTAKRLTAQGTMLVRKSVFYLICVIIILSILNQLDFKLTALLGAAGIVGIAIGFASQTSVSNIISGLFLISEQPFQVGDIIKVSDTVGVVLSVDLLSAKLRTFDNQFVRIPNEQLIKNQVNNYTHFPIRRLDIKIGVAYREDVKHVQEVLKDVAGRNVYCLDEPEPLVIFTNFGNSALEFLFAVWCVKTDYLKLKQSIMADIKERFDAEDIEIPFPHITLYSGSKTEPFPIKDCTQRQPDNSGEPDSKEPTGS
jgi:small-conductance mechanosensitive channel